MPVYPSIYKAKAVQATGTTITVFIPQVFGDVPVEISEFLGPPAPGMGWVFFQAGNPEHPVWTTEFTGGGADYTDEFYGLEGSISDLETAANEVHVGPTQPTDAARELWYDTEPAPGELKVKVGTTWQSAVTDEVHVGIDAPTNPNIELWYDPDASVPQTVPVAWTALPFANGWSNYGLGTWSAGAYRKIGDIVYLRGLVKRAAGDALTTVATLPTGFYPPGDVMFHAEASNSTGVRIDVTPTGAIAVTAAGAAGYSSWLSLAQIFFSVTA